jgi:hypothetical protein
MTKGLSRRPRGGKSATTFYPEPTESPRGEDGAETKKVYQKKWRNNNRMVVSTEAWSRMDRVSLGVQRQPKAQDVLGREGWAGRDKSDLPLPPDFRHSVPDSSNRENLNMQLIQLVTIGALLASSVSAYVVNMPGVAVAEVVDRANRMVSMPRGSSGHAWLGSS